MHHLEQIDNIEVVVDFLLCLLERNFFLFTFSNNFVVVQLSTLPTTAYVPHHVQRVELELLPSLNLLQQHRPRLSLSFFLPVVDLSQGLGHLELFQAVGSYFLLLYRKNLIGNPLNYHCVHHQHHYQVAHDVDGLVEAAQLREPVLELEDLLFVDVRAQVHSEVDGGERLLVEEVLRRDLGPHVLDLHELDRAHLVRGAQRVVLVQLGQHQLDVTRLF